MADEAKTALDRVRQLAHAKLDELSKSEFNVTLYGYPYGRWDLCEEVLAYLATIPSNASEQIARLKERIQQAVEKLAWVERTLLVALETQDWDAVRAALYSQPRKVVDADIDWARSKMEVTDD